MTINEKLLLTIQANPDLPIISMVDSEVVADDCYSWWLGSLNRVDVDEIAYGRDRVLTKSIDDDEDVAYQFDRDYDELSDADYERLLASVEWKKAIILWIGV